MSVLSESSKQTLLLSLILAAGLTLSACLFIGEDRTPASYKTFSGSKELKQAKEIRANLDFPIGQLELDALPSGDSSAYRVDVEYNQNRYSPDLDVSGESSMDFRFDLRHLRKSMGANDKNRGEFRFNRNVPIELHIKTGVGENRVDLTHLKVRDLTLLAGVGEARITVTSPNTEVCHNVELKTGVGEFSTIGLGNLNFRDLRFKGGVGEANLDLTGEWTHDASLDLKVGVGALNVVLPSTVGAELHATRSFLSGLSLKDFQKESSGTYRSNNYEKSSHRLTIDVKSGIGGIDFRWR